MGGVISTIQDTVFTLTAATKALTELNTQYQSLLARISSPPGLPVPNPTASYWLADPPFPHLTDIQDPLPKTADVVIIGSGITGAAVAKSLLELSDGGLDVVVCEARTLCSGATGRNGGHIKASPYELFANLRGKFGEERARAVTRFQRRHLEVLLEVGEGVPEGEVREVETVDLFLEANDFKKSKGEVKEMEEWLEEKCTVWEADEVRSEFGVNSRVVGGISYKAGALWPYRLVTGVWNKLVAQYPNLTISTHTAVEAITPSPSSSSHPYIITTSRGTFSARHVIHATNAFASQLVPSLRRNITGALAHMSAQRPGTSFPASHGKRSWSPIYLPGFDYVTQRPDGEDGQAGDLMVGGGFFRSAQDGMDQLGVWDDGRRDLLPELHIRSIMPAIFEPNYGAGAEVKKTWSGILGITGDMMPLVGRLPNTNNTKDSGEWVAAGFCGEGMVWAWLCGTALAVMVLGREEEELEKGVGRPGGVLRSWFPGEELGVNEGRLGRADLKNLVDEFLA